MPPSVYRCGVCGRLVESRVHCGSSCVLLLDGGRRLRLSKLMSLLLRHRPELGGLKVDAEGFVEVRELVEAARRLGLRWVREEHVKAVAELDSKGRFELRGSRVRARYGHSIPVEVRYEKGSVPDVLYHGTTPEAAARILREGLKPMGRRMVHLSSSIEDAIAVGRRKCRTPVVLAVDAKRASEEGVEVYRASSRVYVAKYIPPKFIRLLDSGESL